jgi:hypothetical protein
MPPNRKKDNMFPMGSSLGAPPLHQRGYSAFSGYPHPGLSPIRHKKVKGLREQRDASQLRYAPREGPPARAVFHNKPPPAISPRMVRRPFSESSNQLPYRVPKPWYESELDANPTDFDKRRLFCDQKVCTKLQAQKDFMRPGW